MAHPDLMPLMAWFALEQKADNPSGRGAIRDPKLAALIEAQNAGQVGAAFPPGFLLTTIMALATAGTTANPFGPSLDRDALTRPDALRRNIAEAIRLLSEATAGVADFSPRIDKTEL